MMLVLHSFSTPNNFFFSTHFPPSLMTPYTERRCCGPRYLQLPAPLPPPEEHEALSSAPIPAVTPAGLTSRAHSGRPTPTPALVPLLCFVHVQINSSHKYIYTHTDTTHFRASGPARGATTAAHPGMKPSRRETQKKMCARHQPRQNTSDWSLSRPSPPPPPAPLRALCKKTAEVLQ
jgi:hypothetical protein